MMIAAQFWPTILSEKNLADFLMMVAPDTGGKDTS